MFLRAAPGTRGLDESLGALHFLVGVSDVQYFPTESGHVCNVFVVSDIRTFFRVPSLIPVNV